MTLAPALAAMTVEMPATDGMPAAMRTRALVLRDAP